MKVAEAQTRRKMGRPMSFDRQTALQKAMLAFWRTGYETTSVNDLTAAMGITAPSLYTAFGDKRQLFLEAARLYLGDPADIAREIEGAPTAFDAARTMLTAAAQAYTGELTPRGCLMASATASGSAASADVQAIVAGLRGEIERHLRARVIRDINEGVLPPQTDPAALSGLVMAVTQGLSVLARDGADRVALLGIVGAALAAWPANRIEGTTA
ncbi:TetR/AcrR family transcriptional regulator [Lichenifustis flavocetrariae]|uniref:TetR/AcrR family transcriptional regulator n=1 Tax=Lichenifustis flavocetrariae TaxID=2949735 RepID=A0AA42CMP7_9HYPH|nr:TetR/AcrR family transcriptional regulator [Lichenifustis flavocetrariae]MCW6512753.1 TetR/AcrR family transcriptional regulator [Lichenifustis flavocetrariae]